MEEVRANNVCREYKCTTEEPVSLHVVVSIRGCLCRLSRDPLESYPYYRDPYDVVTNSPIIQPVTYCMNHYNERIIAALNSIRWKAER